MLKNCAIGLILAPAMAFAYMTTGLSTDDKGGIYIKDATFSCEYFTYDKADSPQKIKSEKKKGTASVYVENFPDNELFTIVTLSDSVTISSPELSFVELKNDGVAYGYVSNDITYQLISTPKTGFVMAIDGDIGKVRVKILLKNCKVSHTVNYHGGDDDL